MPRVVILRATYLRDQRYGICLRDKESKVFASNRPRGRIGVVGRHGNVGDGIDFGELDQEICLRASGKARVNIGAFSEASSGGLL